MKTLLVTGSSGLIGSEVVRHFAANGWRVHGIDNNMRADFFGKDGDTRWNLEQLRRELPSFTHHEADIRDRVRIPQVVAEVKPDLVVHAAAQPSHDLAASRPFDDFDVNAGGTLNMLESVRLRAPGATFVHMSTNKVYGDRPNTLPIVELETRWEYANADTFHGVAETMSIDGSKHSLFGASKVAADVMVQEYGRYFGMHTCCLRGGCLTGPAHSGVELHGFLSYLVKCNVEGRTYRVFGYKGKQVRDNIHSADVSDFIERFAAHPRIAEVYNIGGGRGNSCSILEAFAAAERRTGRPMQHEYVDRAREGDHIVYISDLRKMQEHYPGWGIQRNLDTILDEIVAAWTARLG